MEEFALVEADFQQYYQLDLDAIYSKMIGDGVGFLRYARLFANLPSDSRIMKEVSPAGDWTWNNETQSRVLYELSQVKAILYNSKRGKGQKPIKSDEQFQPDYVKDLKEEYLKWKKEQEVQKEDIDAMRAFWQARNPGVKQL